MPIESVDFLIIGGGVIGLRVATELKRRFPNEKIRLIEKERACGTHASGRNSGVLHAGFYYTEDSLKARLTRDGNERLTTYCIERGLRINRCGKLVVARSENDHVGLQLLFERGKRNGVEVHLLTEREVRDIEPCAHTTGKALYSPTTSSVGPSEVMGSFSRDATDSGVEVFTDTAFIGRNKDVILTTKGRVSSGYTINAAGLYADKVARSFGFSRNHRILPFKGLYFRSDRMSPLIRTHIYPVPDLANPFLGVHLTCGVDNEIKIGPTAIPALWREHYSGLSGFRLNECIDIVGRECAMLFRNDFGFRALAASELRHGTRSKMLAVASSLLRAGTNVGPVRRADSGIRAQLVDVKMHRLEMDFHYEGDRTSFHVLNAVSPAFTCAIPFGEFLCDEIENICR